MFTICPLARWPVSLAKTGRESSPLLYHLYDRRFGDYLQINKSILSHAILRPWQSLMVSETDLHAASEWEDLGRSGYVSKPVYLMEVGTSFVYPLSHEGSTRKVGFVLRVPSRYFYLVASAASASKGRRSASHCCSNLAVSASSASTVWRISSCCFNLIAASSRIYFLLSEYQFCNFAVSAGHNS